MFLILTGHFMPLKSNFLAKSLSAFAGLRSAGFKYLIKFHLKHSLSSIFRIVYLKPLKACSRFVIFTFFSFKNVLHFLYHYIPTFSACLIVFDNLCEIVRCPVTDFI